MWLPTFIGQNTGLQRELLAAMATRFPPPWAATDDMLDAVHRWACSWLEARLKIHGLFTYLDSMTAVNPDLPVADPKDLTEPVDLNSSE
jgi:hypothetical protein